MKLKARLILSGIILISLLLCYLVVLVVLDMDLMTDYIDPRPPQVSIHKLCVIVPYRDRLEELREFSPHMSQFLHNQNVSHHILIINQTDSLRFNRASLINVGWNEADRLGCDYMVMNDVDLLPINPEVPYKFPEVGIIRHITSPEYHPKYHYEKFIGGILMLTLHDYKKLNGMSNKYWGWGLEDDEFYLRIVDSKLNLTRVSGLSTNSTNTFRHIHGPKRKRDYTPKKKDMKQWEIKRKRDHESGLRNVRYTIENRRLIDFSGSSVTVINVALYCDMSWTPYCKS
ncbi:unnamed protein product [Caenorhabditis nigoni]|uniref:Galactosyltransferase N-terminal domain-containing protein n=1 Tax=Caenorhabditis nigoni TaxID=1611254 RepID=A0A2G5UHD2_9PELO|nr:hypothetical protein B9Z55_010731 [Caenorhabditis nigoni]